MVREKARSADTRLCLQPSCESECRRGHVNEPVSICRLKRFAAENDSDKIWKQNIRKKAPTGKKAAVIGAGPAGLTAAWYLVLMGHEATVFEAMPEAGGMLRYGVPEFRLPREVLAAEIRDITDIGVEIRTDTAVDSIDALFDEGYEAVLIAVGAHDGLRLRIPGSRGDGVLVNTQFLRAASLGEKVKPGDRVLVLGGGNVAVDCARVARRLGAAHVMMACLESREAMPASPEELEECAEEGVAIYPSRTSKRILREDGKIIGVEFLDVLSFAFDEDKRLQLETAEGSEHVLEADAVIFAVGQRPVIPDEFGIDKTNRGFVDIDPYTMKTSREGVFAAADAVTGTDKVVSAVASGRKAAAAIDRFFGGRGRPDIRLAPT